MSNEMGELNGHAEFDYNGPNEQNRMWARHLAEEALEAPQDLSRDQRLPTDVFVVVAEILVGDRDLHASAQLNLVNRQIHESTLPVLYETVIFANQKAFERSMRFTNPKGWKYTKYLFVTKLTLALLRLHLRYQTQHLSEPTDDLVTFFPRLELLGLADETSTSPRNRDRPLHLTLYKPIRLPVLILACIPYKSNADQYSVTFFGTYYLRPDVARKRTKARPSFVRDIVQLDVRPGAYIVRNEGWTAVGMEAWHPLWSGYHFKLEITGEITDIGVENTLRTVVNHLTRYASTKALKKVLGKKDDIALSMKCSPSVLERFIELYESRQPAFLNLIVDLTAPVTKEDMKRYLFALGSTYSQHWGAYEHEPTKRHQFVGIHANAPALLPSWVRAFNLANDPEADQYWMQWHGEAQYGYSGEADDDEDNEQANMGNPLQVPHIPGFNGDARSGFVMTLCRALMCGDQHQHGEQFWSRGYPCVAPAPAAPANPRQGAPRPPHAPPGVGQLARARVPAPPTRPAMTPERAAQINAQMEQLRQNPGLAQQLVGMNPEMLRQFFRPDAPRPLPDVVLDIARA
ncbi:hypothetical protein QFC21_005133 [Naganishia friedmannii]|uniref:Uncharacterized protein n=1 Tax=Naganishia friedmannii TaxID=89922 RepID=A0ACC2VCP1_9TREE|nr:hypothetical protein QFC21_005133 [Naganishia friedmannii]